MKKEMIVFTVFFICAVLTFSAAGVRAEAVSTSTSKAWMDWTSLTISGDITWSDKSSQSYADVSDATGSDTDYQPESGWVDTNAFASVYHAYGNAYTDGDSLYEEAYAIANDAVTTWASADEVGAYRSGTFTADSNEWVTFSADYELWQELLTDCVGEFPWTSGYAEAGLYLANSDTSVWDQNTAELANPVLGVETRDGTLTVEVWFDAGNVGQFQAWVYNEADVQIPEPATIGLLGLGSLLLCRNRKFNKKQK
jgi:hypothetical protein